MKQFTKLMAMLLFTAATQYSCINDADVAIPDKTQSDSNGNVALRSTSLTQPLKLSLSPSLLKTSHWQGQADKKYTTPPTKSQ